MSDLELEPLPDDVLSALSQAPVAPLPPGVAEAVLAKVKVSAGLAAAAAGAGASSSGATGASTSSGAAASTSSGAAASTGAGAVAAKGGATLLLKVLPVLTLTAGVGLGVAADRLVLRPTAVTERVVVERVEVPAPVVEDEKPKAVARPPAKKPVPPVDTLGRERVLLDLAPRPSRRGTRARRWRRCSRTRRSSPPGSSSRSARPWRCRSSGRPAVTTRPPGACTRSACSSPTARCARRSTR